jgi:Ribbon-helix-helix protein, copG family
MARVSKPMKLITLRISEEEKARLDQLAEAGDVTVSRALREGALLYLTEARGRLHQVLGGDTTFHGVRRDKLGRTLTEASEPTRNEREVVQVMRGELQDRALGAIREAWDTGADPRVVLAALGHWLDLVGEVYVASSDETGWAWFLRDYCSGYAEPSSRDALKAEIRGALLREPSVDVRGLLDSLDAGMTRLLRDAERQFLVRRAVLATWKVLVRRVAA